MPSAVMQPSTYIALMLLMAPASSEVCSYTLPLDGLSDYLVVDGSQIWLGDLVNSQIDRLDTASETFTRWELPAGSYPEGMALDGDGNLWWADPIWGELARLEGRLAGSDMRHRP